MANPLFSGRIPPDLLEVAEKYCAETGITRTELLIKSLSKYLAYDLVPEQEKPKLSLYDHIQQISSRLEKLEALELRIINLENDNNQKNKLINVKTDYSNKETNKQDIFKQDNLLPIEIAVNNCYHAVNKLNEPTIVDTKTAVSLLNLKDSRELLHLYKTGQLPLIRNSYTVDINSKGKKGYNWLIVSC